MHSIDVAYCYRRVAWSIGLSVSLSITRMYLAKTAGPIEMPCGMWAGVGPRNHVLDGGLAPPQAKAMLAVRIFNNTMRCFIEFP